jgi:hypothetical protein
VAAAKIDELLNTLSSLCKRAMDVELGAAAAAEEKVKLGRKAPKQPLSVRIRRCLMELRICGYRRAVYLNFLGDTQGKALAAANAAAPNSSASLVRGEGSGGGVLEVSVPADDETVPTKKDKGDPTDEMLSKSTFEEVVDNVEEECLEATRTLYEKEGKLDQLGPATLKGVLCPEALLNFLSQQRERANVQLEGAKRKLREQVATLQEVLVMAPAAAMADTANRAHQRTMDTREGVEQKAKLVLQELEDTKQRHRLTLKPQLR